MLHLNFANAEQLVFWDRDVQALLPSHYFSVFEQWRMAKQMPFLREMGKQAILDFLNNLTDDDVSLLEEHFGQKITVEKLNYSAVFNLTIPLDQDHLCREICELDGLHNLSAYRDEKNLYLTLWR